MSKNQFLLTLSVAVISAFLGGTLGVGFLMPPKVIEAEEFRVVSVGNTMAVLDSTGLTIYDPLNEKPLATYDFRGLSLEREDSVINLTRSIGLVMHTNDAFLQFGPELGLSMIGGEPNISLSDKEGNLVWSAP